MLMARRPVHRLFFLVLSLLFSQLALASYVCPGRVASPNGALVATRAALIINRFIVGHR
jgi:hypothetical protein